MAGPIYKLFMARTSEAWYQLSEDEQNALSAKVSQALEAVGGKRVIVCTPAWATEQWDVLGVEEFPDLEAVQRHTELLYELNWLRYMDSISMLGTEWPPS